MINVLILVYKNTGSYPLFDSQADLDRSKFQITVCYMLGADNGNNGLCKGCKSIYLNINKKKVRWYHYSVIAKISKIIEEENIHIVSCHRRRATEIGVLASLLSKANPLVFSTLHGMRKSKSFFRNVREFLINKQLAGLICVSRGVKDYVLNTSYSLDETKVTVIHNGIRFDEYIIPRSKSESRAAILPEIKAKYWFGNVGRLSEVKNQKNLITAFAKFVETMPGSVLLIAGAGHLESDLKNHVDKCGIRDKVLFLGFRSDIPQLLNALDIFILPSLREGLPLVLLEAMASGLPVIASDVGGIPEVFGKTEMGRLVKPWDVSGLVQAMKELISLPEARLHELGANSRERALSNFSSTHLKRGYEKLFEKAYTKMLLSGNEPKMDLESHLQPEVSSSRRYILDKI